MGEQVKAFADAAPQRHIPTRSAFEGIKEDAPVVQIVNLLITQALRDRASDVHIEPQQDRVRLRFRVDGVLRDVGALPVGLGPAVVSRIKVMANMNIVEKRRAQDGQITMELDDRQLDIRVATAETIWGEKTALRLLERSRSLLSLDGLGMGEEMAPRYRALMQQPYGMIVVTGPTGSGKTTTLYASLNEFDRTARNIMTIEDPVEYTFGDINQIQVNPQAGLTFETGLRAILRHDPDVILVGEIRDTETAQLAIHASLTGYHDRIGVFELLELTPGVKALLQDRATADVIRTQALSEGMRPLRVDALTKVANDVTTLDEVQRNVFLA